MLGKETLNSRAIYNDQIWIECLVKASVNKKVLEDIKGAEVLLAKWDRDECKNPANMEESSAIL